MIRLHRSFAAAEADWRAAESTLVHYAFQRFGWLSAWQETLGVAQRVDPLIVVVTGQDGAPRMLLPLGLGRWNGLRALVLLGGEITDYRGPMLAPNFDATGFPALWRDIVAALPPFDVVRFDRMPEEVEGVPNPLTRLPGAERNESAWMAALPDSMKAFRASRRAPFFGDTRRKQRRLSEAVGPPRLEVAATEAEMAEVLSVMKVEKSRRWLETGNPDHFAGSGLGAFYDLASRRLPGIAHGCILRAGDTPVGAHWGMVHAGRFYYLMIASLSGEWARFSPGRLLTEAMVDRAIADGLRIFDLTVGDEAYKKDWADRSMALWKLRRGATPWGRAALAGEAAWGLLRARAREAAWLRRLIHRFRGEAAASR